MLQKNVLQMLNVPVSKVNAQIYGINSTKGEEDLELEQKAPIYFHQDNQSCLKICSSEKVSSRTKHIATKIHHLKDLQKKTVIKMVYCPTGDMKADILTKPLPRPTFEKLRYNLVMSPHSCRGFVG
ncbi:hypothetical protein LAZ67_12000973 [Cordylochernes scorpioides]|uniref:Uncharacterized protein n=1 Tax=Cordylochernes scorpioides TaxID=51811 RepID=A0ABY6L0Y4_9ARAC|nr:hypothetical protein LAZ67_12000973 [Cordylochernes scorpioides]